jgi:tetratricopeptide (TPR) repeat protein
VLGDLLQSRGRHAEAAQQFALVRAIGQLYAANGVRNDLTLILFELDHGGDVASQLEAARVAYEQRPALAAADTYAWALYRAGRLDEAREKSEEALATGALEPLYVFHAAVIADAAGDLGAAQDALKRLVDLNPRFSVVHEQEVEAFVGKLGVER